MFKLKQKNIEKLIDNLKEDQRLLMWEVLPIQGGRGSLTQIRKIIWDDGSVCYGVHSSGSWGWDKEWSNISRAAVLKYMGNSIIHDYEF